MVGRVGIIGAGHLAGYLLEGFHRAAPGLRILVSDCDLPRAEAQARRWGAVAVADNQELADGSDLVILAVRPQDALQALGGVRFTRKQTLASAAAGVTLGQLAPAVDPARAVRVMPISSAALNRSPTLLCPGHPAAAEVFALLGQVHVVADEEAFRAASVIAAFYGWVYALADETVAWTQLHGVPPEVARPLVLETIRSTADVALARPGDSLQLLLDQLATPGGITRHGLAVLRRERGLEAWNQALDAVLERLQGAPDVKPA